MDWSAFIVGAIVGALAAISTVSLITFRRARPYFQMAQQLRDDGGVAPEAPPSRGARHPLQFVSPSED